MVHISSFVSPDTHSVEWHLTRLISAEVMAPMVQNGGYKYPSMDLKKGLSIPHLIENKDVLCRAMALDKRGGLLQAG